MGRNDDLVSRILSSIILCIFFIVVYFCLDIFNIIEVPKKYSLTRLFGADIKGALEGLAVEPIVNEINIDTWINQKETEDIVLETEPLPEINTYYNNVQGEELVNTDINIDENTDKTTTTGEIFTNVENRMYYSQLDLYGRVIYDEINNHREELKTGTYVADFDTTFNELLQEENGAAILENAFQLSINAFLFDNPQIFYIDITKMYMSTEVTSLGPLKTYRVRIGPLEGENYYAQDFNDIHEVNIATYELENLTESIQGSLYGDTYNQIKLVHDYIISNTKYDQDMDNNNIYTAYGALKERIAVCEGYAKAFKYILDDLGIPCVIACGVARNSNGETESHAWNYVKIDGGWYAVDCTWDDPVIIGSGYISQDVYKRYFLKGSLDFFQDHAEDGRIVEGSNFVYPTISEENYR